MFFRPFPLLAVNGSKPLPLSEMIIENSLSSKLKFNFISEASACFTVLLIISLQAK